jgi:carbonic anhydrase/acetyltransferase-like protein (isoleucine patch superfamily)
VGREPGAPKPSLLSRVSRVAWEEVRPLLSRAAIAEMAAVLPSSAFATTRTTMLRAAGATIGPQSLVQGRVRLTGHGNPCQWLFIGRDTLITGGLHADLGAPLRIGNGVRIGHDVSFLTINHALGATWFRAGTSTFAEIVIEDGCWIASRATILPGVVVGRGCIVAAGAVVTRSVPANTLVAGVPARVIRELPLEGEDYEAERAQHH